MAVPRPILLALLATVLLVATFMATRSSKAVTEKVASPAAPAMPKATAPATPAKPATPNAKDLVRAVVSPGNPVTSGRFQLRISQKELGGKHQNQTSSFTGSFSPGDAGGPTRFDLTARDGKTNDHVVSAEGKAYALKGAAAYALPASPKRAAKSRQVLAGGPAAAKLPSVDPAPWFKKLKSQPGPKFSGVATTHISGTLDSKRMAHDLVKLVRSAGKASEEPASLPKGFGGDMAQAFRGARLDAWVGTSDKIARRVHVSRTGTFPANFLAKGDSTRWQAALDLTLVGVNKPQKIVAPAKPKTAGLSRGESRAANGTFVTSSVALDPPTGLLQLSANYLNVAAQARARHVPDKVDAAIRAHKKVVVFFFQRNGVDDPKTANAVNSLRKHNKAFIVTDSVDNLAAYGQVVQSVGVTRSPSIVIIGRSGRARLVDGYIDPSALAQEVADTR
jgi:hypothetical protein